MSIFPLLFSRSLIHFHTLYLSLPPASMHSLKLCLIASHHSQRHSALSACLRHTCTHMHMHIYQPTAMLDIIWWNPWSLHLPLICIILCQFVCLCLFSSWHFLSCSCLLYLMTSLTLEQGHLFMLSLLWIPEFNGTYCMDRKRKHQNRTSKPQRYSKGRSFLFSVFAQWLHFRRTLYCRGPFIMYRAVLY